MPARLVPKKKLSVLKRARQTEKRNLRNRALRSKVKTLSKNVIESIGAKDSGKVEKALKEAVKSISTAASKGVLHKNTASRNISRLSRLVNAAP